MAKLDNIVKKREVLEKDLIIDLTEIDGKTTIKYNLTTPVISKLKELKNELEKKIIEEMKIKVVNPNDKQSSINEFSTPEKIGEINKITKEFNISLKMFQYLINKSEIKDENFTDYLINQFPNEEQAFLYKQAFADEVFTELSEQLELVGFTQ